MSGPLVMLHLGLGFFHRAHQAWYFHRLLESGENGWVLAGGNIRPDMREVIARLAAQQGRYTLETIAPDGKRTYSRITAIRNVVPFQRSQAELIRIGSDPATRIISFTVTEAGYYFNSTNQLDLKHPDLIADVSAARRGEPGSTIYAVVSAILRERMREGTGKVTLLNCDNLRNNGERFRDGLLQFIAVLQDPALREWVKENTTSPNAMVDRITPRPGPEVAERVVRATGWADKVPVMSESFIQWVIEDDFCNDRPMWERVGVEMVDSVKPYEEAKIRILNGTHSGIAWAGALVGYQFIHEGARDPGIRKIAWDYVSDDVIPCLSESDHPSPIDLEAYRDVVLERFGNPAIRDTNQRVAMDSYAKIPGFIAPTVRERLGQGAVINGVAMLASLFLAFLRHWHQRKISFEYEDQALDPAKVQAICEAKDPVDVFCRDPLLWGALAGDSRLTSSIRAAMERVNRFVQEHGATQ